MTKTQFIKILKRYKKGEEYIHVVLTAAESYSKASNEGKPVVMRPDCRCRNCGFLFPGEIGDTLCEVCWSAI